jgi:hypothetical protein
MRTLFITSLYGHRCAFLHLDPIERVVSGRIVLESLEESRISGKQNASLMHSHLEASTGGRHKEEVESPKADLVLAKNLKPAWPRCPDLFCVNRARWGITERTEGG